MEFIDQKLEYLVVLSGILWQTSFFHTDFTNLNQYSLWK